MIDISNFKISMIIKCHTRGHKSAGLIGKITEICDKPNKGYAFVNDIMVNLYNCEDLSVYWKQRNGELISVDDMDINHLRNILKMLIKAKTEQSTPVSKPKFEMHGEIAREFADMAELYAIDPELTCTCDEFHECQQCWQDRKNESDLNALENSGTEY